MTEPDILAQAGKALYGDVWHSHLSNALEVSPRTVRRWMFGSEPIPPGIWRDVNILLQERIHFATEASTAVQAVINQ